MEQDRDIAVELKRLQARLDRIERHLGLVSPEKTPKTIPSAAMEREAEPAAPPPLTPPAIATPSAGPPHAVPAFQPPSPRAFDEPAWTPSPTMPAADEAVNPQQPVEAGSPPPSPKAEVLHRVLAGASEQPRHAPPSTPPITPPEPPRAPVSPAQSKQAWMTPSDRAFAGKKGSVSLELLIGGKAMAWIGALVVLLAAAFAVAVGVQRGWWGQLPPSMRCLGIAVAGAALIVGGEIALRRIGRAASVGLFAAGLGTLYLDSFATFRFFHLLDGQWAFVLMAVVACLGFAITWRSRFLAIGVLSIIGGYLTPVLLQGQSGRDVELMGYLTMLLGVSLALSALQPRAFRPLRYVCIGAHGCVVAVWLALNASHWTAALVFLSVWWTSSLAESMYAAFRRQSALGNVVATVITTAMYVTGGWWTLNGGAIGVSEWLGGFLLMTAGAGVAAVMLFGCGIEALRNRPVTPLDKLSVAVWCQSGVLLASAVAAQFDGFGQSIGWLAIGLAAVEIGRRLPSRGVGVFGLAVGSLALLRIGTLDLLASSMRTPLRTWGDVTINRWSILAFAAVLATHAAAQRVRLGHSADKRPIAPAALAALGTLLWLGVASLQCDHLAETAAWLSAAVILLALDRFGRRQRYFEISLGVLGLTAARWLVIDAFASRLDSAWDASAALPVLNWQMGLAAAIAATGWWAFRTLRRREATLDEPSLAGRLEIGGLWPWILAAGAVFMLVALSFETDRAVTRAAWRAVNPSWSPAHAFQLLLTLLWTVGSVGLGIVDRALRRPDRDGVRPAPGVIAIVSWVLAAICAAKWIAVDTLAWAMFGAHGPATASTPIANLQMLAGLALAIASIVLRLAAMNRPNEQESGLDDRSSFLSLPLSRPESLIPFAACCMLLWGLSFEVDRALSQIGAPAPAWIAAWPAWQLREILWTLLWASGGMLMFIIGRARRMPALHSGGYLLLAGLGLAWITVDTLVWRFSDGAAAAAVFFNAQGLTGAAIAAMLGTAALLLNIDASASRGGGREAELSRAAGYAMGLVAAVGLILGSLEIDRFFIHEPSSMSTGLSAYWGLYGLMLVLLGFRRRRSTVRYAGLGLLGVTLLKALIVDMRGVDLILRALTFLVVGLLCIGVSIVYAKVAPRMFAASAEDEPPDVQDAGESSTRA